MTLKVLGVALLLLCLFSLAVVVRTGAQHPEGVVQLSTSSSAFSGLELPVDRATVEKRLEDAKAAMVLRAKKSEQFRLASQWLTVASLLFGAIVTFVAGMLGKPSATTKDVEQLLEESKARRKLSAVIGGLAALSTIATGAAAKTGEFAEAERKAAVERRDRVVGAYKDLAASKSAEEVHAILAGLDLEAQ